MKYILIFGLSLLIFSGCSSDNPESRTVMLDPSLSLPNSHGRPNEVLVIADSTLWKGAVGDSFLYYFASPYILLPQPESIFDIRHMTPQELAENTAKKEFKTIFFLADVADEYSTTAELVRHDVGSTRLADARQGKGYTTIVGQNKWARDQQLFYLAGYGEEKLMENIRRNFAPIASRIHDEDMEQIRANAYQSGINATLQADARSFYGVDLEIPGNFKKILHNTSTNTTWYRSDDRDIIMNLLVHKRPYQSESQLTYEGVKEIRNEVGKTITTQQPDSYMRINDVDLPLFVEAKNINDRYTVEARGIWDIVNDFKGGPFISHLILDEERNELILVDGFIFAPSKDKKRNYMQEMELIVSSAEPTSAAD